jgi:F0F1-type ATP synthase delta subunit
LKSPVSKKIDTLVPYSYRSALEVFFEKNKIDMTKRLMLKQALTELQTKIQSMPIMTIRIAFEPNGKQIKALCNQMGILTDVQILLNPVFDPTVIGGAIIENQGKIGDYSYSKRINEKL